MVRGVGTAGKGTVKKRIGGILGETVYAALKMGSASHPYVIERADGLALASYRVLRLILEALNPSAILPPDYAEMDTSVFGEVSDLLSMEQEAKQKALDAMKRRRL